MNESTITMCQNQNNELKDAKKGTKINIRHSFENLESFFLDNNNNSIHNTDGKIARCFLCKSFPSNSSIKAIIYEYKSIANKHRGREIEREKRKENRSKTKIPKS